MIFLHPYRRLLRIPRVRAVLLLMFVARFPATVIGLTITLHVVSDLDRSYVEAGLIGMATTIGAAVGAPIVGRSIDRNGLRPVVAICGVCSVAFWASVPYLSYPVLLSLVVLAGAVTIPTNSLARQFLTTLVPQEQRRTAFSLDTIFAESAFVVGPALAVLVITQLSSTVALTGISVCLGLTAVGLYVTNLPTNTEGESEAAGKWQRPRLHHWVDGRIVGALVITMGSLFTLVGTQLSLIAVLQDSGQSAWTGAVIAVMSVTSVVGGLVYGAIRRSLPQALLGFLLGALVVPVGLFGDSWWLLALALIPMNLMCTPALAAGSESISNLASPEVRGEAMGLLDSATRLGTALGSPVVGLVIDQGSPGWGFAAAGLGGVVLVGVGTSLTPASRIQKQTSAEVSPET